MSAPHTKHAHTPGPWKATSSYGELTEHPYLVWSVPRDRALAQCFRISEAGDDNAVEQAANAALIASAPGLLAERDALRAEVQRLQERCDGLHDAIQEALAFRGSETTIAKLRAALDL
jgi:hypothetical protein